jgi:hypothetical protein
VPGLGPDERVRDLVQDDVAHLFRRVQVHEVPRERDPPGGEVRGARTAHGAVEVHLVRPWESIRLRASRRASA